MQSPYVYHRRGRAAFRRRFEEYETEEEMNVFAENFDPVSPNVSPVMREEKVRNTNFQEYIKGEDVTNAPKRLSLQSRKMVHR